MNEREAARLYENRKLSAGYPDIERLGVEFYKGHQASKSTVGETMECIERLVEAPPENRRIAIVGCGPNPHAVKELLAAGYDAAGIEPVADYVQLATKFLGDPARVLIGSAERLPFGDNSQWVVMLETVLEHVDSPEKTLAEVYRVLAPGGVAYVTTVNRLRFSLMGWNPEFNSRFYNWFPALLKECYVHHHLHFKPALGNYTPRPAVHWPCYSELCRLGRSVGFSQFYSKMDVLRADHPTLAGNRLKRFLFPRTRHHPWLRCLVLSQFGDNIFMLKRRG